jgi:hypothetical protein
VTTVTTKRIVPAALWGLRLAGVLFPLAVLAQAVFAGLFVTGDIALLDMHQVNAFVVLAAAVLWIIAAVVLSRAADASRGLIVLGVAALVVTLAQIAVGSSRILWLHIPLGVGMFAMAVRFAAAAFTYGKERS